MEVLYILIPIALMLVSVAIYAFFWAVKNEQFEDLDAEAHRILFDEKPHSPVNTEASTKTDNDIRTTVTPSQDKDKAHNNDA